MKTTLVTALAALALSLSALGAGYSIRTLNGQTLTDVQVGTIEADSVRLKYSDGIITVPLANLSTEDKKMLGVQARLDFIKKRADDQLAVQKRREEAMLASHKLSKEINAADYPSELRNTVEHYNSDVALRNNDLIEAAPDMNGLLALLDSSAISKTEYERIQRAFEQTGRKATKEEKWQLKRKANEEQYTLQFNLKALDDYKAIIAGTDNEDETRGNVAKGETFVGMPDFALRIVKGEPHQASKIGRHEQWIYVNSKGLFDYYYLNDGKLVSKQKR